MRDTELYRHVLGLVTPWGVERVDLSVEDGRVDVWVEHPKRTRFVCPDCDVELSVYEPLRRAGLAASGLVCVLDVPARQSAAGVVS